MGGQEFAGEEQGQGTVPKHCSSTRGMTALSPAAPTSLEINAEQIQQAPFERVPNYWLPRKLKHRLGHPHATVVFRQVSGWGRSPGMALRGRNVQGRAGSGG